MSKLALITGGQQGIGLGIATALAAAGYRIALAADLPPDAGAVGQALAQLPPNTQYYQHDLTDIAAIPALVDQIEATGPMTTLISNAGVPARLRGDMLEITPENFDHAMNVNLRGGFFLAQHIAKRMSSRVGKHYRSLIFVTSVSAEMVSVDRVEYCISKAGAAMMARSFAARLAPLNIGVFELRPGIIDTPMTAGVKDKYDARIAAGLVPAQRWGQPDDIGQIVVPLAEGKFAFATGAVIPIDGGLSIARL